MSGISKYLYQALEHKRNCENPTIPVRDAFVLALDDYYKEKIDIYTLKNLVKTLWRLEYLTENIEGLNPDLYFAFDLLAYIPSKEEDLKSYRKHDEMTKFIERFYTENKTILDKYQKLPRSSLSGDLKVRLR